jgi:hypothetical protein
VNQTKEQSMEKKKKFAIKRETIRQLRDRALDSALGGQMMSPNPGPVSVGEPNPCLPPVPSPGWF